jgi:glycosyltransferase involved in cell wall biosynthesis
MRDSQVQRDITVLICTFNRSELLRRTLESLSRVQAPAGWRWDVLIVDNNSSDDTRAVVDSAATSFPVPMRYAFEGQPGKSSAFNRGIAETSAAVIASTDDDVIVSEGWLTAATAPLLDASQAIDYTGGPVEPAWEAPPPSWFPTGRSDLWGTIAILDYGAEAFVFEDRHRVPLGANVAFRRSVFDRVGGFLPTLGRSTSGSTILGQELPELFRRGRAAGLRGQYVPAMRVRHHVPAVRLTRDYFRRWWFGKGVCRARVDRLHPITELGIDLRRVAHVMGIPRFMIRDVLRDVMRLVGAAVKRCEQDRVVCYMRLAYFAGYSWDSVRVWWHETWSSHRSMTAHPRP